MEVILKGIRFEGDTRGDESFVIAKVKGTLLLRDGGCFLSIISKSLSAALVDMFNKIEQDDKGVYVPVKRPEVVDRPPIIS